MHNNVVFLALYPSDEHECDIEDERQSGNDAVTCMSFIDSPSAQPDFPVH